MCYRAFITQYSRSLHLEHLNTGVDILVATPFYFVSNKYRKAKGTMLAPLAKVIVDGSFAQLGKKHVWQAHSYWFHTLIGKNQEYNPWAPFNGKARCEVRKLPSGTYMVVHMHILLLVFMWLFCYFANCTHSRIICFLLYLGASGELQEEAGTRAGGEEERLELFRICTIGYGYRHFAFLFCSLKYFCLNLLRFCCDFTNTIETYY